MELFKLFGTILVDNEKANASIHKTEKQAESASGKIGKSIKTMGTVVGASAIAIGSAVVGVTKMAVDNYKNYEQLTGGIETLFKDSSKKVMDYAKVAYKTAGMDANKYMETVTSFSASLLNSLGGDTEQASDIANMAITDMSDNANKMGTSMEMIQNAYQGFAKGNYTMLDNLKLGYGGTKTEMQRLLKEAQKISGVKYDISNLNDVFNAIHVIQEEMGITGTTALEAQSTIEGSFQMMKASWENLVTGFADKEQNIGELVRNMVDSVGTYLGNLVPIIMEAIPRVLEGFGVMIGCIIEQMPTLLTNFKNFMVEQISNLFNSETYGGFFAPILDAWNQYGVPIFEKLKTTWDVINQAWRTVFPQIQKLFTNFINTLKIIWDRIGKPIFDIFIQIVGDVVDAFNKHFPTVSRIFGEVISTINTIWTTILLPVLTVVGNFIQNEILPKWQNAWNFIKGVVKNVFDGLVYIWDAILKPCLNGIIQFVQGVFSGNWSQAWNGIKTVFSTIVNAILGIAQNIFGKIVGTVRDKVNSVKSVISNGLEGAKGVVSNIFENIKNSISTKIERARQAVVDCITKIKNAFNFTWSLPKLKVPKITVRGGFSIFPPRAPKFDVEWYKKGGILEEPTAFGFNPYSNKVMVGGESGAEAIAPISELQKYLHNPNDESMPKIIELLTNIFVILNDDERIRNTVIDVVENCGFTVEFEGRELGRIVRKYA